MRPATEALASCDKCLFTLIGVEIWFAFRPSVFPILIQSKELTTFVPEVVGNVRLSSQIVGEHEIQYINAII